MRLPRPSHVVLIALLVLTPALGVHGSAAAAPAVYGGEIAATDDPIVLTSDATGRRLARAVIGWSAPCESGQHFAFHGTIRARAQTPGTPRLGALVMTRNARGAFAGTYTDAHDLTGRTGSSRIELTLRGALRGRSASGTLRAVVVFVDTPLVSATPPATVTQLDRCTTGTLRWTAAHDPGVVYGGATNQDEAIVLARSKDRRSVRRAHVGWHAACLPEGWVDFPETFAGFPLNASGRFGDAFTWRYPDSNGKGDNVYDYELRGRLSRGAGTGSFSAKVTYADGAVCDAGSRSWTVRSS